MCNTYQGFIMNNIYTEDIVKFISENYPKYGSDFCANYLGEPFNSKNIRLFCHRNKIKFKKKYEGINFDIQDFLNISTPQIAYYLGLSWADASLDKKSYRLSLEVTEDDGVNFYEMIKDIGMFTIYKRTRVNRKPQMMISLNNKKICDYLESLGFREKSLISPSKLLKVIPIELHDFFWLGYFDGDGCFYNKNLICQACFSGSYNQDWSSLENYLINKNIRYKIKRFITKLGHKYSALRITSKHDIVKLGKYFYKNELTKLGLKRKYEKYLKICEVAENGLKRSKIIN